MTVQQRTSGSPAHTPGEADLPLVSVVVPTHGRPALVRETVRSIVGQTYTGDIECLVVHDREEPDASLTELSAPGRVVRVTRNACAPGLAGARNTGLDQTSGSLIASCDDDDLWHPEKIARQVARMKDDPDLLVVGTGLRLLFPSRVVTWPARAEVFEPELILRSRVKELHSSTMLMRREVITRAGRYDEDLPNGYGEDYDFVLRASAVGKVGCVIEPLADIRKDAVSYYLGKAQVTAAGLEMLLAKHPEIATSRRGHARLLGQIAYAHSTAGHRAAAWRFAARSLRRWPAAPFGHLAVFHLVTRLRAERVLQLARVFGRGLT